MEEPRVKAFRVLKSPCVNLSQVALRYKGKKATGKDLVSSLETLSEALRTLDKQTSALDPKLAEYVFFPLSHIFRDAKDLPVRVVEIALQCLQILISCGWREQLSLDLGKQLLILLCFLAGGCATDGKVKDTNEELATVAFECLLALLQATRGTVLGANTIRAENVPVLGHCVTVILDGITDGPSVKVRLAALTALERLITGITDYDALKNVFPGIVSSLTKVLSSKSGVRQSYKIISASLNILAKTICQVIGDERPSDSSDNPTESTLVTKTGEQKTRSWTAATASQVKMALANILPLRYHERVEVRTGLLDLCGCITEQCRNSLSQCIPMLMETMIAIHSQCSGTDTSSNWKLAGILGTDAGLLEMLKDSLHGWIVALPRIMQSNDDTRKQRTIAQISTAFKVLECHNTNLDILSDSMALNLRGSISSAIQTSSRAVGPVSESSLEISQLLQMGKFGSKMTSFDPILFGESSNRTTMAGLQELAIQLTTLPMATKLQQGVANTLRTTSGDEQLAGLWLCLQLLNDFDKSDLFTDQYLNLPSDTNIQQPLLDDTYAFSLEELAISTFEDEDRWKLQCLNLEVIALQACHQGYEFRPELVDALYPILERLGSSNAVLQQHAITCLNIVSTACEYPNAAALIVDNADYLVNAVSLKLNTFDISPQAPQVLVMMIRLSGPALIPYLDDLVESIFSIIACYHGYPKLVESLFSVLNAIVEEAVKASTHSIKPSANSTSRPKPYQPLSITDLVSLLRSNREAGTRLLSTPSPNEPGPDDDSDEPEDPPPPRTTSPPTQPLSKTHTLIQSIASLTPSHLTTPSPPLRANILTLLVSALPVLATHTNTFLPLAATLWPAITTRLYDPEPYVNLAAANALSALCERAGDFLIQRVEDEWSRIRKLYSTTETEMREEVKAQGKSNQARGMRWRVWDAVVGLLVSVVRDVGVDGEMEDGVFEMLGGLVGERADVREVLEGLNADALWLVEEKERVRGGGEALMRPETVDEIEFRDVDIRW